MRRLALPLIALLVLLALPRGGRAADATATVTRDQNVRSMGHLGAAILEVLHPGAVVHLHARLQDSSWVDVTAPDGTKGWMFQRYLQVDDTVVAALPTVGSDYMLDQMAPQGDAMPGMPQPTPAPGPTAKPAPTATPDPMAGMNAYLAFELPAGDPAQLAAPIPVTVTICVDLDQDRTCGPLEGVAGALILVSDATTAAVLASAVTDASGKVTLNVPAPADPTSGGQLIVSAPTLAWTQPIQGTADRPPAAVQDLVTQGRIGLPLPLP
jgi:hypothetical protein